MSEIEIDDDEICECGDCGEEVFDDDYSCPNCGAVLDWNNEGDEGILSGLTNWINSLFGGNA